MDLNIYGPDRWYTNQVGSETTMQQEVFVTSRATDFEEDKYISLTYTGGSGNNDYSFFATEIENVSIPLVRE